MIRYKCFWFAEKKKISQKKKRLHQHRRTGSSRSYDFFCRWIWVLCIPTAKYNLTRFNLQAGHMALSGFCDTILRQWQLLTIYNEHLSNKIRRWEIEMQLTLCSFEMYLRCTWTDIACSLCHFISFINIGRNKSRVSIALDCMGTGNEQINIRLEGKKKYGRLHKPFSASHTPSFLLLQFKIVRLVLSQHVASVIGRTGWNPSAMAELLVGTGDLANAVRCGRR